MHRSLLAFAVTSLFVAGCSTPDPSIGEPQSSELTLHAPEAVVGPLPAGNGETPPLGWFTGPINSSANLPLEGAVLNFSIEVIGRWDDKNPGPAYQGENWIFRLSLRNGTVQVAPDADWLRSYTLHGEKNARVVHETSFKIGDLLGGDPNLTSHPYHGGTSIVFVLTYHKIYESGPLPWEAHQCELWFYDEGDHFVGGGYPSCRYICRPVERPEQSWCPWYDEHGKGSPPPNIW